MSKKKNNAGSRQRLINRLNEAHKEKLEDHPFVEKWILFLDSLDSYGAGLLLYFSLFAICVLLWSGSDNTNAREFSEDMLWMVLGGLLTLLRGKTAKHADKIVEKRINGRQPPQSPTGRSG